MCFIAILPEHKIAHIAEEDIECYKIYHKTNSFMHSAYQNVLYLNTKYHNSVILTTKISPMKINGKIFGTKNALIIEEGIHAYRNNKFLPCNTKAVVPKGTLYYMNDTEIVAEKMIIYNPYPIED